jgi:hypothetical protein
MDEESFDFPLKPERTSFEYQVRDPVPIFSQNPLPKPAHKQQLQNLHVTSLKNSIVVQGIFSAFKHLTSPLRKLPSPPKYCPEFEVAIRREATTVVTSGFDNSIDAMEEENVVPVSDFLSTSPTFDTYNMNHFPVQETMDTFSFMKMMDVKKEPVIQMQGWDKKVEPRLQPLMKQDSIPIPKQIKSVFQETKRTIYKKEEAIYEFTEDNFEQSQQDMFSLLPTEDLTCPCCNKEFELYSEMIKHEKTHSKLHECTFEGCSKKFTRRSDLFTHQRVHTGERPFVCEACRKTFTTCSNLRRHEKTHKCKPDCK